MGDFEYSYCTREGYDHVITACRTPGAWMCDRRKVFKSRAPGETDEEAQIWFGKRTDGSRHSVQEQGRKLGAWERASSSKVKAHSLKRCPSWIPLSEEGL